MANTISPNMGLIVPGIGTEPSPTWASDLNSSLSIVDQHNHSVGHGVQIQPNGININTDLAFNANNATLLRTSRYVPQLAALTALTDIGCVYVVNNELFYNDVSGGHQVQITTNGSVNSGAGSISGLPSGTASASYNAGTFVWQQSTSTAANMDLASIILRNATSSSNGLTLNPPPAMASSFSITLPYVPALASQSFLAIDTSGNISGFASVSSGLTGSNVVSNVNLAGKAVQESGLNVVVSNTNATNSLAIVRGLVSSTGTIISGEGFTVINSAAGTYDITYTAAFSDVPAITTSTVGQLGGAGTNAYVPTNGTSSCRILIQKTDGSGSANQQFNFIAIGQRA